MIDSTGGLASPIVSWRHHHKAYTTVGEVGRVAHPLFPTWSAPWSLTALVAVRVGVNAVIVLLAVRAGVSRPVVGGATLATLVSGVLTVAVLRPGGLGLTASHAEQLIQLGLVGLAVVVAARGSGLVSRLALAGLAAVAVGLGLLFVPIYGEATVAP